MIPDMAVKEALDRLSYQAEFFTSEEDMRTVLEAAAPYILAPILKLVSELIDADDCSFDHHGGCQAHGYLTLKPGETCPQRDAKELIGHYPCRDQA